MGCTETRNMLGKILMYMIIKVDKPMLLSTLTFLHMVKASNVK